MQTSRNMLTHLKHSIKDKNESDLFAQHIYESTNFNANADSNYILQGYFQKQAFGSKFVEGAFEKEEMIVNEVFGKQAARIFTGSKLRLKD